MRVTIVTDDNLMLVDDVGYEVDCSQLIAGNLWAMQWYDTFGEEEYRPDPETGAREPNKRIEDFSPYEPYLTTWQAAKAKSLIEPFLDGMSMRLDTTATMLGVLKHVRQ